ncbi:MAG: phosphatidate cytidylyltransferase, partial [Acidimicrobiales bacterium]
RPPPAPPAPPGPMAPEASRSGRDLPVAVASGLVLGVVALVFFKLGTVTSMIVATGVITLAAVEAYAAFRRAGYHPATLLGLVATVSLMVATYNKGQEALPLVLVMVVAFTMLWHLAGVDRAAEPVRSTAATLLVFCWVAVFGSFAALLLDPSLFPDRHGIAFLLGAVVTGVAYDVGALAVGAWVGRHPLGAVSPNKTWEGLAGGAVASVLAAVIVVHLVHPWTLGSAVALGFVVAVVSPIGDLSESLVKRHLGLKDMGRILPGHGGLLDRVDGLLFVLPATYYLVKAFNLG